jgi:hypothetical protein
MVPARLPPSAIFFPALFIETFVPKALLRELFGVSVSNVEKARTA